MIKSFKSKALKLFWLESDPSKLPATHIHKIQKILQAIDYANIVPDDLKRDICYEIHALKGALKGYWSMAVSGNYRIIFTFINGNAYDVDYIDYH